MYLGRAVHVHPCVHGIACKVTAAIIVESRKEGVEYGNCVLPDCMPDGWQRAETALEMDEVTD